MSMKPNLIAKQNAASSLINEFLFKMLLP